ncbi:MAG TPA: hypothetical protein VGU66_14185 [Candidatus Elarobacter sp.]|nr:hypothetical protein [Candidatus Elarobacter sp.]
MLFGALGFAAVARTSYRELWRAHEDLHRHSGRVTATAAIFEREREGADAHEALRGDLASLLTHIEIARCVVSPKDAAVFPAVDRASADLFDARQSARSILRRVRTAVRERSAPLSYAEARKPHDGCHARADVCDSLVRSSSPYAGRTMRYTTAVVAAALLTSSFQSPIAAQEGSVQPGPRAQGEAVVYRLHLKTAGVKEGGQADTTLTLTRTPQGVRIASTSPAEDAQSAVGDDGVVRVDGRLRAVAEPYNQLQSALRGRDRDGRSTVNVFVADQEVSVPVACTSTDIGGSKSLEFTGQTTARIRGVGAHIAVDVRATVVRDRVESASARNTFDASVPFRKIHIDQVWSLTRLP